MDTIDLTLCQDCALIYGAGYSLADLGHDDHDHRGGGESWAEYMMRVESWDAVGRVVLTDEQGDIDHGAFTCTLCDDVSYGRMYRATAEARA